MCKGNYAQACNSTYLKSLNVEQKEDACRHVSYSYARAYEGRSDPHNKEPITDSATRIEFLRKAVDLFEEAKNLTNPTNDPDQLITQAKANIGYIDYCLLHENVELATRYLKEAEAEKDPDAGPWLASCIGKPEKR